MSAPAIHQFVAGFSRRDAISLEALQLRHCFREMGHPSEIWGEIPRISTEDMREVRDVRHYRPRATEEDVLLLHLSAGSKVNQIFAEVPGRKVVLYHNITPSEGIRPFNGEFADALVEGRRQMHSLAGVPEYCLADSTFNARELEAAGYGPTAVFPLVLDFSKFDCEPDPQMLEHLGDGLTNILFVGRGVPNKCWEDLLYAFHAYHNRINRGSRLILAGSFGGMEKYFHYLQAIVHRLDLNNVEFFGSVSLRELVALYRSAHLWLGMSAHEGFCIPIVEAFHFRVPVLAYAAGAVPETLGSAAVLIRDKRPELVAEMMQELIVASPMRETVLRAQDVRLRELVTARDLRSEIERHLGRMLGGAQ